MAIPYWLFPIGYSLLAIPYWLFPIGPPKPFGPGEGVLTARAVRATRLPAAAVVWPGVARAVSAINRQSISNQYNL